MTRPTPRRAPSPAPSQARNFTLLWVWLGFLVFWMGVAGLNHFDPPVRIDPDQPSAPKVAPLAGFFTDDSHVLAADQGRRFNQLLAAFEEETSSQVAVMVYPHLPSGTVEDFTIRTAEQSRLGRKHVDNGAILFVFMDGRLARLEVGYGLEGALPDLAVQQILETALTPAFAQGRYGDGLAASLGAVMQAIRTESHKTRTPSAAAVAWRYLNAAVQQSRRVVWPALRQTNVGERIGLSFFASLLGIGLWSGLVNGARLTLLPLRGGWNLLRRRPLLSGVAAINGSPIVDSFKLLALVGVAVSGIVLLAGGGAFGGAGAMIHW